ncbi:MAG: hypothetical protein GWP06_06765 [Actinobacteria bacterium]|nr:hypothetical protein [Actinomycetota bacterium]
MSKMWNLEFDSRSGKETWNNSQTLVARESATLISTQPETCLHCSKGALVDVVEKKKGQATMRRALSIVLKALLIRNSVTLMQWKRLISVHEMRWFLRKMIAS